MTHVFSDVFWAIVWFFTILFSARGIHYLATPSIPVSRTGDYMVWLASFLWALLIVFWFN